MDEKLTQGGPETHIPLTLPPQSTIQPASGLYDEIGLPGYHCVTATKMHTNLIGIV